MEQIVPNVTGVGHIRYELVMNHVTEFSSL